ncbi:hypothetical protein [Cryptosporangium sp. NPDC048952]|uniref:hypothetical protein n=1 Tax=Cryptosporangium sp. NPDC048952 TaxID=3363961 RepID=UPI00371BC3BF
MLTTRIPYVSSFQIPGAVARSNWGIYMKTWVRNGLAVSMLAAGIAGSTAVIGASAAQAAPCTTPGCTNVGGLGDDNGTTVGAADRSWRRGGTNQGGGTINSINVPAANFTGTVNVGGIGSRNQAATAADSFQTGFVASTGAMRGAAQTGGIGSDNGTVGAANQSFETGSIAVTGSLGTTGAVTTGGIGDANGSGGNALRSWNTGSFTSNGTYNGTTTIDGIGNGNVSAGDATDAFGSGNVNLS